MQKRRGVDGVCLPQIEAANVLLRYGADVNVQCPPRFDRRRAIDFAVMVGCSEVLELLLDAGASLSLSDGYSLTPLDSAVVHDRPDVCRLLLSHRADPNELNADGCTALQVRLIVTMQSVTTQTALNGALQDLCSYVCIIPDWSFC